MDNSKDRNISVAMTEQEYDEYRKQKDIILQLVKALESERETKEINMKEDPRFINLMNWYREGLKEIDVLEQKIESLQKESPFIRFLRWFSK